MKIVQETPFELEEFWIARRLKTVTGIGGGTPAPAAPTVDYVSTWNTVTGGGTLQPTLNAVPNVAGNLIIFAVAWFSGTVNNATSVTDTAGNTYTFVRRQYNFGDTCEFWFASNIKVHAANVIRVTLPGTVGTVHMRAAQIRASSGPASYGGVSVGIDSAGPLPSITTTRAYQLIIATYCLNSVGGDNWIPAPGWTEIGDDGNLAFHGLTVDAAGTIVFPSSTNAAPVQRVSMAMLFSL